MSNTIMEFAKFIFTESWKFFQIQIPGTSLTFGSLAIGLVLINFGFKFLYWVLGATAPEEPEYKSISVRSPGLVPVRREIRRR